MRKRERTFHVGTRLAMAAMAAGCDDDRVGPAVEDTASPVAIDTRPSAAGAPSTYKGLTLELVDNGSPIIEPVDGVVGLVCIGMSNGRQECEELQERLRGEYADEVHPDLRVANCAVGGHAIERWIDEAFDDVLWRACVEERLPEANLRVDQVRVVWHKAANQFTTLADGSPKPLYPRLGSDYDAFRANLSLLADRVRSWFPAVEAVYTSSRSYGGFAGSHARGEPLSYEEGHALNSWLEANPSVDGVWYGWAAYLWAPDCATGEVNGSGVCYERAEFVDDGVHPSETGRAIVAALLHARFLEERWYRRP